MSPTNSHHDYYAILEIPPTADLDSIRSSYKRLAKIRHPDKNPTKDTTAEFQLLQEAHTTLSDRDTRQQYDAQYQSFKSSFGGTSSQTHHSTKESAAREDPKRQRIAELEKELERLKNQLESQESDLSAAQKNMTRLQAEVTTLQAEINDIMRQQAANETWWGYFSLFISGRSSEIEGEKRQRDRDRLQKIAAQRVKQSSIFRQSEKIGGYQRAIRSINEAIISTASEIRRYEEMEREEIIRQFFRKTAEEANRRQEKRAKESKKTEKQGDICRHQGWWIRTEGRAVCSRCSTICRRFAFRCPGCDKMACAECRTVLKKSGEHRPHTSTAGSSYDRFWGN